MNRFTSVLIVWLALLGGTRLTSLVNAAETTPAASSVAPLKDYDGYFPFKPPERLIQWEQRAEVVRRRILVAEGLWPMPTKTPLDANVHGLVDRPEYTVEKVFFQSYPGLYVTGNLYRPKGKEGKRPGVLVPHGHNDNGRFGEDSVQTARNQIAEGAERFESGGRYHLQAMCVQLARMGCVVFHYDMLGLADSQQLSHALVHRFDVENGKERAPREAGFYSAAAELRCQSIMGLQTYNSIRALDFITSLPDVDAARIGVTGASGGGTQTMILAAIDPRVAVSVPVVMVSTSMQGGCTCENASLLRVGTGNIEFAGLFAPKPQLMISANDWTKELGTKGLPELQQLYKLMGAPDHVAAKLLLHFGHNYNFVSREAMYQWFNQYLKLNLPSPVLEEDFKPLSIAEMSVWDERHPKPPGGEEFERTLSCLADGRCRQALGRSNASRCGQPGGVSPRGRRRLENDSHRRACAIRRLGITLGKPNLFVSHTADLARLRNGASGAEIPLVMPSRPAPTGGGPYCGSGDMKQHPLTADEAKLKPEVRRLTDAGWIVIGVDLVGRMGDSAAESAPQEMRRVPNPRRFLGFTLGYNIAPFAQSAQETLGHRNGSIRQGMIQDR